MKLRIKRDQREKKGLLGGSKGFDFTLFCQAEVDEREKGLVDKYKMNDHILTTYHVKNVGELPVTVKGLIQGRESVVEDVVTLLALENEVKNACASLKTLLEVMATFGGEEVVEI